MRLANDFSGSRLNFYDATTTSHSISEFIDTRKDIDSSAIYDFLLFGTILPPHSPLKGVHQLYPGEIRDGGSSTLQYNELTYQPLNKNVEAYVDEFDRLLESLIRSKGAVDTVLLSGGIDSAVIASYIGDRARCLTWGGKGKDTPDVHFAGISARTFGVREHHVEYADFDRDMELYKDAVRALKIPILFNSAVPFLRLSAAAKERGITEWFMGQNADTLFMAYPAPVYTKRFSILNSILPTRLFSGLVPGEKGYLLKTSSIVRLLAYFKSLGTFPGDWISLPSGYFEEMESIVASLPVCNLDQRIIMTEELLTESRRNQICQHELPFLHGIAAHCPYYERAFVEEALRVPARMRAHKGYSKQILKALAKKRGVPDEVIYKRKTGLSYGFKEAMEHKRHLPVWDAMEQDSDLNAFVNVRRIRERREDNYLTFIMLMSLYYWFELVARPEGLRFSPPL